MKKGREALYDVIFAAVGYKVSLNIRFPYRVIKDKFSERSAFRHYVVFLQYHGVPVLW